MMERFSVEVRPRLQNWKNYFEGQQAICNKSYNDASKPCNKVITNYCADIVSSYNGYIASPGYISYTSNNDISEIMDCLRYNDYQDEDSDFLNDALIYGVANELMYNDSEGRVRFRLINPLQSFGVFDDALTNDLLYFVRWYKANEWDNSDLYKVDVYSNDEIKHYEMNGVCGALRFINSEPHYFNQCPANIFIESNMKKALQRRVELIAGVASLTLGEDVFRDIQITFTRNIPSDNTDVVNLVQALQGVVSNKTLLSMIPQVNDVDAEIEALEQERNEKIKIYDFEPANNVDE